MPRPRLPARIAALLTVAVLTLPVAAVPAGSAPAPLALIPLSHAEYPLGSWKMFHANPEHTGEGDTTLPPLGHIVWSAVANGSTDKPEGGAAVDGGVVYVGLGTAMMAFNATSGTRLWSYGAGARIFSTPALYNGMVYFGAEGAFGGNNSFALYASNGTLAWAAGEAPSAGGGIQFVHGSPTVVNGLVYYGSYSYALFARYASNGTIAWSTNLTSEVVASPAEAGGTLFVTSAGIHSPVNASWDAPPRLWAFNSTTGAPLWNATVVQGHLFASPVVAGGVAYAATAGFSYLTIDIDSGYVLAYDAVTGAPLWGSTDVGRMIATPAVYGSVMYVAGAGNFADGLTSTGARLRWLDLSSSGAIIREQSVGDNASMESSPAAVAGRVVAAARDGAVALYLASGARLWSYDLPQEVIAPVAVANEMIFVPALDGRLYAFGAQPDFSVTAPDISLTDTTPHAGEPLTLQVTVHNLGDKKGSAVAYAEANQSGRIIPIATWNVTDLDKFSQLTLTAPVRFPLEGTTNITVNLTGVTPDDGSPANNQATAEYLLFAPLAGWTSRYADGRGTNFLETETPQNNVLLWRQDAFLVMGGGFVAYGPTVVFADNAGPRVLAVPRSDGSTNVTWFWDAPAPIVGSPVLVSGSYIMVATALATDPAGNATFIDADTGVPVATAPLPAHPTTSGVAHDDSVLIAVGDRLVELSTTTFAVERQFPPVDVPPASRPALRTEPVLTPGWAFVASSVGELHAFNLTTATEPPGWPVQLSAPTDVPLVIGSGFLMAVNGPNNVSAFALTPLAPSAVWNATLAEPVTGAMAVGYGRLFVPTATNVTAFVAGSGAFAWNHSLAPVQRQNAIRAAGNNTLYVGSERLFALSASTGDPEWEFEPGADGNISSSAALLGGTLHLQTTLGRVLTLGLIPGRPPTAVMASPIAGKNYRAGEAVNFSSAGTFDPDNEQLAFNWDFGDGNFSNNASDTHAYGFAGEFRVILTVADGLNLTSIKTLTLRVIENQAPTVFVPPEDRVQPDVFRQNLDDTVWTFKVRYIDPDNDPPSLVTLNITNETEASVLLLPVNATPYNFSEGVDYSWTGTLASGYHSYFFRASDGLADAVTPGNNSFAVYRIETRDDLQLSYTVMYVGTGASELTPVTGLIPPPSFGTIDKFSITLPATATNIQWIRIEFRYGGGWVNVSSFRELTIGVYSLDRASGTWHFEPSVPLEANDTVVANISIHESPVFSVENGSQRPTATFGVFGQPTVAPHPPTAEVSTGGRSLFSPGDTIAFSAANSVETNDGNQSNLTFEWHFADGSPTLTGMFVNHTFATAGIYEVDLVVYNGYGQSAQKRVTITVRAEGSTSTFLGLAAVIVGALFAIAVVWPVSRRRAREAGNNEAAPTERAGRDATAQRRWPAPPARVGEPSSDDHEQAAVDELTEELENSGSTKP